MVCLTIINIDASRLFLLHVKSDVKSLGIRSLFKHVFMKRYMIYIMYKKLKILINLISTKKLELGCF